MKSSDVIITRSHFDAVIFDLDGVLTRTATVHAAAWKQLFDEYRKNRLAAGQEAYDPFDKEKDYRDHVDGKPRYDGIASFLQARNISIPFGDPDDPPDQETVCGLGNRKNALFLQHLDREGVRVYDSSIGLVRNLRRAGFKVAVISASKNCQKVLRAAGIETLFDARVDGMDAEQSKLKGKPAPDVFVEAARCLGAEPSRAVIIEDALAGVEAGRAGGFGLVLGVDRSGQPSHLRTHGADAVVSDLAAVRVIEDVHGKSARRTVDLPSALDRIDEIAGAPDKRPVIFLDYDGTLTPIVAHPEDAVLSGRARDIISRLAEVCHVAIVSGRDLADIRERVGLEEVIYAGSHGFDISGPDGMRHEHPDASDFLPALDEAEKELLGHFADVGGAQVERKKYAIAVHFRNVARERVKEVEQSVASVASKHPNLRKAGGKEILELQPDLDWNKGRAVMWLLKTLDLDTPETLPIYLGDDLTDEDAFRALESRGVGIVVRDEARETEAKYAVENPDEVAAFLERLVGRISAINKWTLVYEGFEPQQEGLREALCTLGNGYFATRGAAPESADDDTHYPGTYLAGGYNRVKTEVAGRDVENEDLVNLPNWLVLEFRLDGGEWFDLRKTNLLCHRQELDLKHGVLTRIVRFDDADGRRTTLTQRRLVSMSERHLAALETTWLPENWSGRIEVRSALDGRVTNNGVPRYRDLNGRHLEPIETGTPDDESVYLKVRTSQSELRIALAARTRWFNSGELVRLPSETSAEAGYIARTFTAELSEGQPLTAEKIVSLFTSRDHAISECGLAARGAARDAENFAGVMDQHVKAWRHLWERFDMELELSEPASDEIHTALVLHFHIFHLLQTNSPHTVDLDSGVPSRGWHGEAYRGHVFWDELFVFPMLNLRVPDVTRALLKYRHRRIGAARRGARAAGHDGAMYPWQSGSDGREESQILHLNPKSGRWLPDNTHLQRHINAAIVYNVWQYYQISGDREFLYFHGVEIILEIARFWASLATYNSELDRYEILGVMGPDEYHDAYPGTDRQGLDNNAYTNLMAVWVLCRALELFELIPEEHCSRICRKLAIRDEEIALWQDASRKMRLVFHEDGILSQFEGYSDLEEFPWDGYREKYGRVMRLDRILEAEGDTPNRYKASKQADVLMLFYLFSAEELQQLFERLGYEFDRDMIHRNIDYYLKRTSNGSTLSGVVDSWVLARSNRARSWCLFTEALKSDIADIQGGTTPEGIHLGAMAGTVDLIQRCYTGIEAREDVLWINPQLPDELACLRLRIRYREASLYLVVTHGSVCVRIVHCPVAPIRVGLGGRLMELKEGEEVKMNLSETAAAGAATPDQ